MRSERLRLESRHLAVPLVHPRLGIAVDLAHAQVAVLLLPAARRARVILV